MRSVLLACVVAAIACDVASAHGTIAPTTAAGGSTQRFVVTIPNDSVNVPMTGFRLVAPAEVAIESVEAPPGWTASRSGATATWAGELPAGEEGRFAFTAVLPSSASTVAFQGEESYPSVPNSGFFPLAVALTPAAESESSRWWIVAAVAGSLLVVAAAAIAVRARGRSPRP